MILSLCPDAYKRAPEMCSECDKRPAEFGGLCSECLEDREHRRADKRREESR
jgi:hypothetical protein